MNLTALAALVQVAKEGSFAGASRVLGLSPSAASKAISRLEQDLGVRLFQRTTRRVSLTPEGQRYADGAEPLLNELEILTAEIIDSRRLPQGRLRIGAPETFGRRVLAPLMAAFQKQYPKIQINLQLDDRNTDLVSEKIDIAIRTGKPLRDSTLVSRRFMKDPLVTVVSPDYIREHGEPQTPDDLMKHACISFRSRQADWIMPWRFVDDTLIKPNRDFTVNDMDAITRLVTQSAGIAQIPLYLAQPLLATGELKETLVDFREQPVDYRLVYPHRKLLAPRVRVFVDFISNHYSFK